MAQKDKQTYNIELYIKKIKATKEVYAERKKFLEGFSLKRKRQAQRWRRRSCGIRWWRFSKLQWRIAYGCSVHWTRCLHRQTPKRSILPKWT